MGNDQFLSLVAKMYYLDKVKQNEIAKQLHTTPMAISRALREAESRGIVTFHVKLPWQLDPALALAVKEKYGLRSCFALEVEAEAEVPQSLGSFLADYFEQILPPQNAIVGLSWGTAISRFVEALPYLSARNCSVIQLTGAFAGRNNTLSPSQIVNELSKKLDSHIHVLNAPLYASSEEMRRQLVRDPTNQLIREMACRSDINIIGASDLGREGSTLQAGIITEADFQELQALNSLGDLAGTFLDARGGLLEWSKSGLNTGVSLRRIASGKEVICIAGETRKAPLLRGACARGYFNTLITTTATARLLLLDDDA